MGVIMTTQTNDLPAELPRELRGWNWGAFFLNWIWGLGNRTYIALLMLLPLVGFVMIFVLGAKGNEWAWKNGNWRSVEHFKKVQRAWALWGLASWVVLIGGAVWFFFSIMSMLTQSEPYQNALFQARNDEQVQAALGTGLEATGLTSGSIGFGPNGKASFLFPVKGSKSLGTLCTLAQMSGGGWDTRLLVVEPSGGEPIVLVNDDNIAVVKGQCPIPAKRN